MDIVIPYKQSATGTTELKYALRSIEKYLLGYDKIFIVGDVTKFINVIHIPCDHYEEKQQDICLKILAACKDSRLSEKFIMWHDDHLLLSELHVRNIKDWHNGSLKNELKRVRNGYKIAIENTIEKFTHGRYTQILNYDIHTPCVFSKTIFKIICSGMDKEYCLKSFYFNYGTQSNDEYMTDLKINEMGLSEQTIMNAINGRLFFSSGPNSIEPAMIRVLASLYDKKSIFEK